MVIFFYYISNNFTTSTYSGIKFIALFSWLSWNITEKKPVCMATWGLEPHVAS